MKLPTVKDMAVYLEGIKKNLRWTNLEEFDRLAENILRLLKEDHERTECMQICKSCPLHCCSNICKNEGDREDRIENIVHEIARGQRDPWNGK